MITTDIEPFANQTAVEHPWDFGEREFTEAIEAIRQGVWKSWTTLIDSTVYSRPGSYRCDVFMADPSTTNHETKFIKCGPNANVVVLVDSGEFVTKFPIGENSEPIIGSPVMREVSQGIGEDPPTEDITQMAGLVMQACWEYTDGAHVSFDDEDGWDFHLRLSNGHLVMANIFLNGGVDASVYDDSQGTPVKLVRRLRRGQTSGEDLIELFKSGGYASSSK